MVLLVLSSSSLLLEKSGGSNTYMLGAQVEMDKNLSTNVGQFVPSLRIAICTSEWAPTLQTANHKIFMELQSFPDQTLSLIKVS